MIKVRPIAASRIRGEAVTQIGPSLRARAVRGHSGRVAARRAVGLGARAAPAPDHNPGTGKKGAEGPRGDPRVRGLRVRDVRAVRQDSQLDDRRARATEVTVHAVPVLAGTVDGAVIAVKAAAATARTVPTMATIAASVLTCPVMIVEAKQPSAGPTAPQAAATGRTDPTTVTIAASVLICRVMIVEARHRSAVRTVPTMATIAASVLTRRVMIVGARVMIVEVKGQIGVRTVPTMVTIAASVLTRRVTIVEAKQ